MKIFISLVLLLRSYQKISILEFSKESAFGKTFNFVTWKQSIVQLLLFLDFQRQNHQGRPK